MDRKKLSDILSNGGNWMYEGDRIGRNEIATSYHPCDNCRREVRYDSARRQSV
jgi:hypothetical protein